MNTAAEISFDVSREDAKTINKIVARGWALGWLRDQYANKLSMTMDITAVHANGNPLRLNDLLNADDFNFAHDMSGICRHLNRDTGRLGDHFSPRFSARGEAR